MHDAPPARSAEELAAPVIDIEKPYPQFKDYPTHISWALSVSGGIRKHWRFKAGSQEAKDLDGVALLTLVRLVQKFDPAQVPEGGDPQGQFRGWAHSFIKGDCQREARRIRNGGTYHTRRESGREPVVVEELPRRRDERMGGFVEVEIPDPRVPPPECPDDKLAMLEQALSVLTDAERVCLELRFGVGCEFPLDGNEVANKLCMTRAQVAELEASAIAKMKNKFGASIGKALAGTTKPAPVEIQKVHRQRRLTVAVPDDENGGRANAVRALEGD